MVVCGAKVVQVTNIAPQATKDQMQTLFGFLGKIEDIRLYPTIRDVSCPVQSRICYIKFSESVTTGVAQHMTNTVFIDRALIVIPIPSGDIPDEYYALEMTKNGTIVPGLCPSEPKLPPNVVNSVSGIGIEQVINTTDPQFEAKGLPSYPPLPANYDSGKIEEIRRTLLLSNLEPTCTSDDIIQFFKNIGEIKYLKTCTRMSDTSLHWLVEFSDQHSVVEAFALSGKELNGRIVTVTHATQSIVKPQAKSNEAAQREIEEAMTRVKEAQSLISSTIDPVIGMLSSSKDKRTSSSRRSRSRSRGRRRRSRSRSRSRRSRSRNRSRRSGSRNRRSRSKDRKRRSRSRKRSRSHSRRSRTPSSRSRRSRSRGGGGGGGLSRRDRDGRKRTPPRDKSKDRRVSREKSATTKDLPPATRDKSPRDNRRSSRSKDRTPDRPNKDRRETKSSRDKTPSRDRRISKEREGGKVKEYREYSGERLGDGRKMGGGSRSRSRGRGRSRSKERGGRRGGSRARDKRRSRSRGSRRRSPTPPKGKLRKSRSRSRDKGERDRKREKDRRRDKERSPSRLPRNYDEEEKGFYTEKDKKDSADSDYPPEKESSEKSDNMDISNSP